MGEGGISTTECLPSLYRGPGSNPQYKKINKFLPIGHFVDLALYMCSIHDKFDYYCCLCY